MQNGDIARRDVAVAETQVVQPAEIVKKLFMQGKMVTVNQEISFEEAEEIALDYEIMCEKEEKVDVIGLSGLITPSLEEMVHVASALEKAGLDIPLLVGGATTSLMHTALKIAPVYHAPVLHMKDASQNALATSKLLNPVQREVLSNQLEQQYQELRNQHADSHSSQVSIEEARQNKLNLF